jgi:hypothetical protein
MHGFCNLLQVFALAFKATRGSNVTSANVTYCDCNVSLAAVLCSSHFSAEIQLKKIGFRYRMTLCELHGSRSISLRVSWTFRR